MFKKALVATAVFAATSGLALANGGTFAPAPEAPHHVGSFYAGVDISRDRGHYEYTDTDVAASGEGIDGGLFVGYGMTFMDRYYLGLEGFGDISSNDAKLSSTLKFEQNWSAGVSLMPGIKVTDSTLLFARVGWINSEFKLKDDTGVLDSKERNLNGIQAGLGMEVMCTQNIGLRGEWDWSHYEKYKTSVAGTGVEAGLFDHPTVDQFKFGIDYHFNMA